MFRCDISFFDAFSDHPVAGLRARPAKRPPWDCIRLSWSWRGRLHTTWCDDSHSNLSLKLPWYWSGTYIIYTRQFDNSPTQTIQIKSFLNFPSQSSILTLQLTTLTLWKSQVKHWLHLYDFSPPCLQFNSGWAHSPGHMHRWFTSH